jgi:hypothetical protein
LLTKDQAQAISNALLQPARAEQVTHAAAIAQQQHAVIKRKWLGGGALLGLAGGGATGSVLPGCPFTAGIIGLIVGTIIGALVGKIRG